MIDHWLGTMNALAVIDEASVAVVRERVRAEGAAAGLSAQVIEAMVIVASELAHNQRVHAHGGQVVVRSIARDGVPGIEVLAVDQGDGIADPTLALEGRAVEPAGLGIGLSGARRMADELDFDVRIGAGTAIWARKFAAPVARRREVAIFGRALEGERVSGDHGLFVRTEHTLLLAVADGLGHGEAAWDASSRAIEAIGSRPVGSIAELLAAADGALIGTRGAVAIVARVDESAMTLEHAGIGDARTQLAGPRESRLLPSTPGILGLRSANRATLRQEQMAIDRYQVIVMSTDGLTSRATLANTDELLQKHPLIIAHYLFKSFARSNDDALVLVAR